MALLSLKSWTDPPEELRLNKSPSSLNQLLKLVYITQSVTYFNDFSLISALRMNELMNNIILSNITRCAALDMHTHSCLWAGIANGIG